MSKESDEEDWQKLLNFDWSNMDQLAKTSFVPKPIPTINEVYAKRQAETWPERCKSMLSHINNMCSECTMCELGRKYCDEKDTIFGPHVFSNMNPSQWMIVGQNPGFNECLQYEPFVGDAGKYFNDRIIRHGVKREKFYITNCVKCHTIGNEQPTFDHMSRCEPFLRMEIGILRPKLVITLGAVAFGVFCPELLMKDCFGKIVESKKFGVKVYPVYHPSPRNTSIKERKECFDNNIRTLCKLILACEAKIV